MDNKLFGTKFAAVMATALILFGLSNAGAFTVDRWIFPTEEFGDNTYIGTTDVSNMEVTSAKTMFSGQVESWRETADLQVTYQDASASYPLDNAEILLEETVQRAETGAQNNFVFQLSEQTTSTFLAQNFPAAQFTVPDIEAITTKLEVALEEGKSQTRVVIGDELVGLEREMVASTAFSHSLQNPGAQEIINVLNGFEIAPNSTFSFLDILTELSFSEVNDQELTEIASAIYGTVLQTNFIIDERSIGTKVPAAIPLGQEAAINRKLGVDLVFTNPNNSSFTLSLGTESGSLISSLSGYPFNYQYVLLTGSQESVKPRLIKQFSSFVSSGFSVKEPGSDGVRAEVLRSVMADGEEVEVQSVSTDFYPPVNRVELYPLTATIVETTPGESTTNPDGSITNPDGTITTPNGTTTTPTTPSTDGSGSNSGTGNSTNGNTTNNNNNGTNNNGSDNNNTDNKNDTGTSDGSKKPSKPVYDKGGNVVNP